MADEKTPEIAAETNERPEWLPTQFKSGEDLAKSYDEVRRETDRLRTDLDKERTNFTETLARIEAQTAQQQAPAYDAGADPLVAQYGRAMADGDYAQAILIQTAISQQATAQVIDSKLDAFKPAITAQQQAQKETTYQMAYDRVAEEYGERWAELYPQVDKMLSERQSWLPDVPSVNGYVDSLREAAQVIEAKQIVSANAAAERDRTAKLQAQGITGNTSRAPLTGSAKEAADREWAEVQNARTSGYSNVITD